MSLAHVDTGIDSNIRHGTQCVRYRRMVMDATNRESIASAQKAIQTQEGRLHILVNKYVSLAFLFDEASLISELVPVRVGPYLLSSTTPRHQSISPQER